MSDRLSYVYGVVGSSLETATAPAGIDGGPVSLVSNGDVAALITSVSAEDYAPDKVETLTADVEWVSDRATAHDRVLTWASDAGAVIPFPMWTLFTDTKGVSSMLSSRMNELRRTFDRIRDGREFIVRAYVQSGVLKGHLALATARVPVGTTGSQLDALARYSLWQVGLDYDHGTGHGVGAYLSVHEGPHRISKVASTVALQPGMIVSNEPGYYKTGAYGIRIENLVAVKEAQIEGADRKYLEFETVTLAPIDINCIDLGLMTEAEKAWLNAYHVRVREVVEPQVDEATRAWLKDATRAI